ncbi:CpaF family protein [Thermotalea metallivorans]|uniref:Putative conjugal transfer protein n=1 Tax=Thermotalea metallivorans TaxID=520762 RepID=A0A140L9Y6_9FIRM|nr:CpaF family protein [Thermotalea metallivorans]KXG77361.1 putative conjugal transfer protein [Thermotalea metallivorans]
MSGRTNLMKERLVRSGRTVVSETTVGQIDLQKLRDKIKMTVLQMDSETLSKKHDPIVKQKITDVVMETIQEECKQYPIILREKIHKKAGEIIEEVLGYGPIEALRKDPEVTEIMINGSGKGNVWYEKHGRLEQADVYFPDEQSIRDLIEKIVSPLGRRCDESSPYVDARLPDGSRVHAIIPPLALKGATVTIRKHSKLLSIEEQIALGTFTEKEIELLKAFIKARLNIFISGGTGTGKTTALNTLSSFIPDDERIITIEDSAELKLEQPHVVSLEARPANMEGKGEVTIRELVRNALRMRPTRIVVGECRAGETLDMLQAMNTGHEGSLSTGHANSPKDMLLRLETMVLMGFDMPISAIRQQIAAALDIIIQYQRFKDGSRKLVSITEVLGYENGEIKVADILVYDENKKMYKATGHVPKVIEKIQRKGIPMPKWLKEMMK